MATEEKIVNKIITLDTIIDVAKYLESQKNEYNTLFENDRIKNENLKYNEQIYEYKGDSPKVQYTIKYKDGREVTEPDYNWFVDILSDSAKFIDRISINSMISYSTNKINPERYEYMHLYTWLHFNEDSVSIRVDGTNLEEQVYRTHSYLKGIIEENEERYNKTVKNRNIRIQSFCLTIGFVLSYIVYFVLNSMSADLPEIVVQLLDNKYVIVFGQWFVAAVIGNIFGFSIMMALYKNILPKTKYSHYDSSSHKSIYIDNIDDYVSKDEVLIGEFANNGKNREKIEKIYNITSKLVLVQILISILLFLVIK